MILRFSFKLCNDLITQPPLHEKCYIILWRCLTLAIVLLAQDYKLMYS